MFREAQDRFASLPNCVRIGTQGGVSMKCMMARLDPCRAVRARAFVAGLAGPVATALLLAANGCESRKSPNPPQQITLESPLAAAPGTSAQIQGGQDTEKKTLVAALDQWVAGPTASHTDPPISADYEFNGMKRDQVAALLHGGARGEAQYTWKNITASIDDGKTRGSIELEGSRVHTSARTEIRREYKEAAVFAFTGTQENGAWAIDSLRPVSVSLFFRAVSPASSSSPRRQTPEEDIPSELEEVLDAHREQSLQLTRPQIQNVMVDDHEWTVGPSQEPIAVSPGQELDLRIFKIGEGGDIIAYGSVFGRGPGGRVQLDYLPDMGMGHYGARIRVHPDLPPGSYYLSLTAKLGTPDMGISHTVTVPFEVKAK